MRACEEELAIILSNRVGKPIRYCRLVEHPRLKNWTPGYISKAMYNLSSTQPQSYVVLKRGLYMKRK